MLARGKEALESSRAQSKELFDDTKSMIQSKGLVPGFQSSSKKNSPNSKVGLAVAAHSFNPCNSEGRGRQSSLTLRLGWVYRANSRLAGATQ